MAEPTPPPTLPEAEIWRRAPEFDTPLIKAERPEVISEDKLVVSRRKEWERAIILHAEYLHDKQASLYLQRGKRLQMLLISSSRRLLVAWSRASKTDDLMDEDEEDPEALMKAAEATYLQDIQEAAVFLNELRKEEIQRLVPGRKTIILLQVF